MKSVVSGGNRLFIAFGIGMLLLAPGCKKGGDPLPPPPPPPSPATIMQVVSIDPSTVQPNAGFPAKIYGAGFFEGATVFFGSIEMPKARVENPNTIKLASGPLPAGTYDVTVENSDGSRATLRSGLVVKAATGDCNFVRVNFDFDMANIRSDASSTLNKHIACYQARTGNINVEGHADARGTTEYNLALGNRRAQAVVTHLKNKGVGSSRLTYVSYGEERPVERGSNEAAWAANRRADIHSKE